MRIYEELFIVKPDAIEEEVDQFIEQMKGTVSGTGGTVDKVEKWGKRRLAYKVDKFREGTYVLLQFTAGPETVREFERKMRVADMVIKFLTVRIDEDLKRIEKRRKSREKRAHKRASNAPAPSVAPALPVAPAMPAAQAAAIPGAPAPGAPVVHAAPAAPVLEPTQVENGNAEHTTPDENGAQ